MSAWCRGGLVGLLLLASGAWAAPAQEPLTPVYAFDAAEIVLSEQRLPPPESADWRPVALPDNWYVSRPGWSGVAWYRVTFTAAPGPYRTQTLYAPRISARQLTFFLNDEVIAGSQFQGDARALNWDPPLRYAVAPDRLRPGVNVIHVRVEASADLRQGLTRFALGPADTLLTQGFRRYELQVYWQRMAGGAALLVGMVAIAFWRRRRRDP